MNPTVVYAKLCQDAYSTTPTIGHPQGAARCVIRDSPDGRVFTFVGTDNFASTIEDLEFIPEDIKGMGQVHGGMYRDLMKIHDALWQAMGNQKVILNGHSLGADHAILWGAYLCLFRRPPEAIFAFEPAKPSCDDTIARLFTANQIPLFISTHGSDPVPQLPLTIDVIADWQFPGPTTHLGKPASLPHSIEDHRIGNVIQGLLEASVGT